MKAFGESLLEVPPSLMFSLGQGAQWSQMGLDLLNSYPVFLNTIRYLDQVIYAFHEEPACSLEGT